MSDLLRKIDERTKLAGTNRLEILLFSLGLDQRSGRRETFGVNVFKVREVMRVPPITSAPEMPASVEGMVSLRGQLVPVVDLVRYVGVETDQKPQIMIVTEYNQHVQGFLVEAVDTIMRLEWSAMRVPPDMVNVQMAGLVTAVTELADKRLAMMVDMEKILSETTRYDDSRMFEAIHAIEQPKNKTYTLFYADDSATARAQIQRTLDALGVKSAHANNGKLAWEELQRIAAAAEAHHELVSQYIQVILTDVEMPEMDGYVLCKNVKSDPRFAGIPVLMYSSLSSVNEHMGRAVGVDAYVSKLQPQKLAEAITFHLKLAEGEPVQA
ncbi:MAG: chemotaxis protein CheV [Sulfuricella sp.]|nr:chemotaxis protein CheV [Sulfuricella sp.]